MAPSSRSGTTLEAARRQGSPPLPGCLVLFQPRGLNSRPVCRGTTWRASGLWVLSDYKRQVHLLLSLSQSGIFAVSFSSGNHSCSITVPLPFS